MRVVSYLSVEKPRERRLAEALRMGLGATGYGDVLEQRSKADYAGPDVATDVMVTCGIAGMSRQLLTEHWKAGIATVFIDKGYFRLRLSGVKAPGYYRFAVNAFQPHAYLHRDRRPSDRWDALGFEMLSRSRAPTEGQVVFAGSSKKYHDFWSLDDPTAYARKQIGRIRRFTARPVVYRPKPSWSEAVPVEGTRFSRAPETIADALYKAYALVTHGSNAALDALVLGVPVIALGENCIAFELAGHDLDVLTPHRRLHFPDDVERQQFLYDVAYCQWTMGELATGEAWHHLRREIF